MISRERYMAPIRDFYDSDLIKVITGIRRCGKSVILSAIHKEICQKSKNVLSLDFEDAAVLANIPCGTALLDHIESHRPDKDTLCYVFLDEIQRLDSRLSHAPPTKLFRIHQRIKLKIAFPRIHQGTFRTLCFL